MSEHIPPPYGCEWWKIGQSTTFPPEDELFLQLLTQSGFSTFTGPSGLVGARCGRRDVIAIHRGRGKRWNLSFVDDNADQFEALVTDLPSTARVANEWLKGGSLESIRGAITMNEW